MEEQLQVASNRTIPREDRLEISAEKRGAILMCTFVLSGGLDKEAANLLNLPPVPDAPIEPYMDYEPVGDESISGKVN